MTSLLLPNCHFNTAAISIQNFSLFTSSQALLFNHMWSCQTLTLALLLVLRLPHPEADAAELAGVDQGVNFLAEAAALVQAFELLPGGDEHAKQFENPQQAQKPQRPQVHRNKGLQVKRRNGQQVNDAKGAAHEAQAR